MNQSLSLIKVQISQQVRAWNLQINPINLALFPLYLEPLSVNVILETNGPG